MRIEVRLSGAGGQGIILAGLILAEAAGIYDGKFVAQTQSYGVEARGGACRSEVVISDDEILFPEVLQPDILVAMNKSSFSKYSETLIEGSTILVDSTFIQDIPHLKAKVFAIPLTRLARETGEELVSNMVALGALASLTHIVTENSLRKAILSRVPKGTEDLNLKALEGGLRAAQKELKSKKAKIGKQFF